MGGAGEGQQRRGTGPPGGAGEGRGAQGTGRRGGTADDGGGRSAGAGPLQLLAACRGGKDPPPRQTRPHFAALPCSAFQTPFQTNPQVDQLAQLLGYRKVGFIFSQSIKVRGGGVDDACFATLM